MKKWLYVISVGGLTILFVIPYLASRKEAEAKEKERLAVAAKAASDLAERKKQDEEKARKDAEDRENKRKAEEKAKEEETRRKWDEQGQEIQKDTDGFLARADKASKEVSRLEADLDSLRKLREKTNREAFDSAKLVEKATVEKQTAELRTQYLLEQIVARAAASSMAKPPAPPVATNGK